MEHGISMSENEELSPELIHEFVLAGHNNLAKVQQMLEEHPGLLNTVDPEGQETALAAASHIGQRPIVEHLLSKGAPMTICTAAMLGLTDEVAKFIEEDPEAVHAQGSHGISLMFHAAHSGKPEIAKLLIEKGGGEGKDQALIPTALFNHVDMARFLLEQGADINTRFAPIGNKTPLEIAIMRKHEAVAEVLREYGASA